MLNSTVVSRKLVAAGIVPLLLVLGACSSEDGETLEQEAPVEQGGTTTPTQEPTSNEPTSDPGEGTAARTHEDGLEIDKAEWRGDRDELWVKVNGEPGDEIRILGADNPDTVIYTHTISESDTGSFKIPMAGDVPCVIRVVRTRDAKTLEHPVDIKSGELNCPG